jgi:hypothetical protein
MRVFIMEYGKVKIGIIVIVFVVITAFAIRYIRRKKMQIKQCKYFKTSEFDSPDIPGSGKNMQTSTLQMLCEARKIADVPFKINSGYRSPAHNTKVKGVSNSAHLKGYAADISTPNGKHQETIVKALRQAGFKRFGIYNNFVHADNDPSKKQMVAWGANSQKINPFNYA